MFTILLHSSKTMRLGCADTSATTPRFIQEASKLARYVTSQDEAVIAQAMAISPSLAATTLATFKDWHPTGGTPAIDTFTGDIYSGFQSALLSPDDRAYANEVLVILSGLYGLLRPLDAVRPYRLEIGYKFPDSPFGNLYDFWGDRLAKALPQDRTIINTSSAEYTKALFPHLSNDARIITPKFLTVSPKTGEPIFVTVHAKIARGAFARWLIVNRIEAEADLKLFTDLGYAYDKSLSTPDEPVLVAAEFKGIGLSVRLT